MMPEREPVPVLSERPAHPTGETPSPLSAVRRLPRRFPGQSYISALALPTPAQLMGAR